MKAKKQDQAKDLKPKYYQQVAHAYSGTEVTPAGEGCNWKVFVNCVEYFDKLYITLVDDASASYHLHHIIISVPRISLYCSEQSVCDSGANLGRPLFSFHFWGNITALHRNITALHRNITALHLKKVVVLFFFKFSPDPEIPS